VWLPIAPIAGLALFLLLLLAIPIDLAFDVEKSSGLKKTVRLHWLFGLVKKEIGAEQGAPGRPKRENGPKRKPKRRRSSSVAFALLGTRGFPQRVFGFARAVLRAVRVQEMKSEVRVGLSDPAETGWLCAAIWPVMAFAPSNPTFSVRVVPDFYQETFEAYSRGMVRLYPIELLWLGVKFVCSPTTFRALKATLQARRR